MSEEVAVKYKDVSQHLVSMAKKDIKMQQDNQSGKSDYNPYIFEENLAILKEIVEKNGWPTIKKVGEEASRSAWLIAQHADFDVEFQKKCLNLMSESGDVDLQDIAMLTDRVAVNKKEKQTYGTQLFMNELGEIIPRPIKDRKRLDTRRSKMGLEPFETYVQKMRGEHDRIIKAKATELRTKQK